MSDFSIIVTKDGPYVVSGGVPLAKQHIVIDHAGESVDYREGQSYPADLSYALCRCGQSGRKPFCDGTHQRAGFDGTEVASKTVFADRVQRFDGPQMSLLDAEPLCAYARFCHPEGQVWNLLRQTNGAHARDMVERESGLCPSGRLVALNHRGEELEPSLPPSIGIIEDTARGESGPLWVRGGIPVSSADGASYAVRNRVTLCRCGASRNKPFCDGTHATIHFNDGT